MDKQEVHLRRDKRERREAKGAKYYLVVKALKRKESLVTWTILIVVLSISVEILFVSIMLIILSSASKLTDELERSHMVIAASARYASSLYNAYRVGLSDVWEGRPSKEFTGIQIEKLLQATQAFSDATSGLGYDEYTENVKSTTKEAVKVLKSDFPDLIRQEQTLALVQHPRLVRSLCAQMVNASQSYNSVSEGEKARIRYNNALFGRKRLFTFCLLAVGLALNLSLTILFVWLFNARMLRRLGALNKRIDIFGRGEVLPTADTVLDEIGRIDEVFSTMAHRVMAARMRFKQVTDKVADGICLIDSRETIVFANPALEGLCGYSESGLFEKPLEIIIPKYPAMAEVLRGRLPAKTSLPLRRADSSVLDAVWSVSRDSESEGFILVVHDNTREAKLTSLIESNRARFQALLDSLLDGVIVFTEDMNVDYINKTTLTLLGIDKDNNEAARIPQEVLIPIQERLLSKSQEEFELAIKLENSSTRDLGIAINQIILDGQKCHVALLKDMSAQRELERLKKYFLRMISHDLRTPVTSISCSVNLIKKIDDGFGSKQQRLLDKVQAELDNLCSLVDNFLDLEKLRSGQIKLSFSRLSLVKVIREAILETERQKPDRVFELYEKNAEGLIESSQARLEQCLTAALTYFANGAENGDTLSALLEREGKIPRLTISSAKGIAVISDEGALAALLYGDQELLPIDSAFQDLGLSVAARLAELCHSTITYSIVDNRCYEFALNFPAFVQADPINAENIA